MTRARSVYPRWSLEQTCQSACLLKPCMLCSLWCCHPWDPLNFLCPFSIVSTVLGWWLYASTLPLYAWELERSSKVCCWYLFYEPLPYLALGQPCPLTEGHRSCQSSLLITVLSKLESGKNSFKVVLWVRDNSLKSPTEKNRGQDLTCLLRAI